MSLVPDYDSPSSSSSEDGDSVENNKTDRDQPKPKLPKPDFVGAQVDCDASSVFKNPFAEAESAKEAILQKHVKMVDSKDNVVVINGKKICWNYRKGRCRFGHNCKFAHDSDIQKSKDQAEGDSVRAQKHVYEPSVQELERIRQETNSQKRKKRPGLTQGLIPGKKVMKNYVKQK